MIYYQYRHDRARRTLRGIDEQVGKAEKAVAGKAPVKRNRFIKLTGAEKSVNRDLEAKARALAGIKGYTTNLTSQTAEFVIGAYHQLWRIEKSFRMSKHDLQARPIYHHKRESIEAHLSIVFAALAVSHWIEHQTGWSIKKFVQTATPLPHRDHPRRKPHPHRRGPATRRPPRRPRQNRHRRCALICPNSGLTRSASDCCPAGLATPWRGLTRQQDRKPSVRQAVLLYVQRDWASEAAPPLLFVVTLREVHISREDHGSVDLHAHEMRAATVSCRSREASQVTNPQPLRRRCGLPR